MGITSLRVREQNTKARFLLLYAYGGIAAETRGTPAIVGTTPAPQAPQSVASFEELGRT